MREYAVYKGEEILAFGTAKQIAKQLKVKERTIYFWSMPVHRKRSKRNAKFAIRLEVNNAK